MTAPMQAGVAPAGATKQGKRLWLRVCLALFLLVALGGLAELGLRVLIPAVIASNVREQMSLPESHPVEVVLDGPALFPALTGHVDHVTLRVKDVDVFQGIRTDVVAYADSMPFDPTKGSIEGATASITIPNSSLDAVVSLASDGFVDHGAVKNGKLELSRDAEMFGYQVPLSATLALGIDQGDMLVEPVEIRAAGFDLSVEQIRPMLGPAASALLNRHTVCVRDRIPQGITLKNVELRSDLSGGKAVVTAQLDPDILSNPVKQRVGRCDQS